MPRIRSFLSLAVAVATISSTSCSNPNQQDEKPLVYEGMSSQELRDKLGDPLSIDSSGKVYDAQHKKKLILEKWEYEKRTVLIINDTVKDSNLN